MAMEGAQEGGMGQGIGSGSSASPALMAFPASSLQGVGGLLVGQQAGARLTRQRGPAGQPCVCDATVPAGLES